jgi:hypothetical protein
MTDPDADPNASGYMDASEDERMEAVETLGQQFNQAKEGMDDARSRFDAALADGRLTEDDHANLTSTYEDQYATLAPRHVLQPKETEERPPNAVQGEPEDPIFREAYDSMDDEEPQPEEPQPPSIDAPASEVIEPTPEVQEKVNQPRPLGNDMSSLRPNTDLYDRFSNEAIREQTPTERDEGADEYSRAQITRPSDDREAQIQQLKEREAEQPQRMAPKTKGGQDVNPSDEKPTGGKMSMKDLVNNSKASQNAKAKDVKKIPTIHGSTSADTVREIMDMAEDGNQKAMSMLYGATGDLEDESHPANHLHEEVLELLEGYDGKAAAKAERAERRRAQSKSRKKKQGEDPSRKDISAPLTEATEGNDNEAIARRLLGNRD